MAVYSVEGKLGTGKTKFAVWRAQDAMREGRRVASNVDLNLEHFTKDQRARYVRLPDKPSALDLEAMGHGNPSSYDEDRNGVLILDELGTWLNSRNFQDKGRSSLLDWLIHARKLGWDVYLIVQDSNMIDRQVREALIEYQCKCMRMDKVRIPLIGGLIRDLLGAFGWKGGYLPRFHLVAARVGSGQNSVVAERWQYRGDWLHKAYDTRQVFRSDYPHGAHSVLHPAYFTAPSVPLSFFARLFPARQAALGSARTGVSQGAPKPKLAWVQRVQRLPVHRRIPALRTLGLLD